MQIYANCNGDHLSWIGSVLVDGLLADGATLCGAEAATDAEQSSGRLFVRRRLDCAQRLQRKATPLQMDALHLISVGSSFLQSVFNWIPIKFFRFIIAIIYIICIMYMYCDGWRKLRTRQTGYLDFRFVEKPRFYPKISRKFYVIVQFIELI